MLDQIAGLPAHPLVVHLPVVLLPLTLPTALGGGRVAPRAARAGAGDPWRGARRFVGAQLATMSGESLPERVLRTPQVQEHAELGEATRTLTFRMLAAAAVYCARVWRDRLPARGRMRELLAPRAVGVVLAVALIATAALTTTLAVRAGHAGAEATWSDLPAQAASDRAD